jgi:hypothetical protein
MYPRKELTALAARKHALQADCARLRATCAAAVVEVARPVGWLDRAVVAWRRARPLLRWLPALALWRAWRARAAPRD